MLSAESSLKIFVNDIMNVSIVTIDEDASVEQVAKLMDKHKADCVIVKDKKDKILGIITERDLITKVLAKDSKSDIVKAKEVMSFPLITIDEGGTIVQAGKKMKQYSIKRLGVTRKGEVVGLVSIWNMVKEAPELLGIIEQETFEEENEELARVGYCDRCKEWSNDVKKVKIGYLCEKCL